LPSEKVYVVSNSGLLTAARDMHKEPTDPREPVEEMAKIIDEEVLLGKVMFDTYKRRYRDDHHVDSRESQWRNDLERRRRARDEATRNRSVSNPTGGPTGGA
jgi:hypothetical protein